MSNLHTADLSYWIERARWASAFGYPAKEAYARRKIKQLTAQGIEAAAAAETVKLGSVHESPVLEEDAPKAKPVTNQQEG